MSVTRSFLRTAWERGLFVPVICMLNAVACAHNETREQLVAVGWVQAAGEIRIYARQSDLGKLYDGSCISGVMTGGRTLPEKLQNSFVSVYGKLVDARELDELALQGITVGVENYCNSPKIAIVTRVVK